MSTETLEKSAFSHVKPADAAWRSGGLRDFFLYKEYLEVVGPADFTTVDMPAPALVPDPTPW